jgi:hypothetical protein
MLREWHHNHGTFAAGVAGRAGRVHLRSWFIRADWGGEMAEKCGQKSQI